MKISKINIDTPEGQYLLMSLSLISTTDRRDNTPDESMESLKENYIKGLKEQIQIMSDIIDTDKKIIKSKDEYIAELELKINELLNLSVKAIGVAQRVVLNP